MTDRPETAMMQPTGVSVQEETLTLPTHMPAAPDRYPAYLDNRVYQGSSGRVYPLPFHDRITAEARPRDWHAIVLQNDYLRIVIVPELGGRILYATDLTRDVDMFYRNQVIKPALVGLTGPWISGGIEFNWPQHHRPATFLPMSHHVEHEEDGSVTVWCSDHDPFDRMKGMHGIRLRPDSALIELRARLSNRTEDARTFMWWANVAARVHDDYQAFFPTDVHFVADHAKRAVTAYPAADRRYYGWDYPGEAERQVRSAHEPAADRLDYYRNIAVPTSYMVVDTEDNFFGGYDHAAQTGFVHVADRRIAPGKKMWTWGNAPFGWAWDRNLTEEDGPYVELMAGVYTDNQPDFSHLAPGETKIFRQYWYPIQDIGVVHQATTEAACHLAAGADPHTAILGVAVTRPRPGARLRLARGEDVLVEETVDIAPGRPHTQTVDLVEGTELHELTLTLADAGEVLLRWTPRPPAVDPEEPAAATEPPAPGDIASVDELYLTGVHLQQYRHATRRPRPYWDEALRRDPGDSRCRTALGIEDLRAGRLQDAARHLEIALARTTRRHPTPESGETHHRLAQVRERTGRTREALDLYGRAAWDHAWAPAAALASARILARSTEPGTDDEALALLEGWWSPRDPRPQMRCLAVILMRRLGRSAEADDLLAELLAEDPLDVWASDLAGARIDTDGPTLIDLGLEYDSVGEADAARRAWIDAASAPTAIGQVAVGPLAWLHIADQHRRIGEPEEAQAARSRADALDATHCFAGRPQDLDMLERTLAANSDDVLALRLLGHQLYHLQRREEAIDRWEAAVALDDTDPVTRRNLALGAMNVQDDSDQADAHYGRARDLAPHDAKLLAELDLLSARRGCSVAERVEMLEADLDLVGERDDLTATRALLLTVSGRADEAIRILSSRPFQPWEGGEGTVLRAWEEAHLACARDALAGGDPERAEVLVRAALEPIPSLGEDRHPLATSAHLRLALGDALAAQGHTAVAREQWREAADAVSDFRAMEAVPYSDLTYHCALAARRLGEETTATELAHGLADYAAELERTAPTVDYFATSLPSMLLFPPDLRAQREVDVAMLRAQSAALLGDRERARELVQEVLDAEPDRERAVELSQEIVTER
ncbi:MAG: DUF5107 domain-containing protein [Brachybacterium sp.]|nr:DUF5107 domain-containing protein [Brachybacterium sp.]